MSADANEKSSGWISWLGMVLVPLLAVATYFLLPQAAGGGEGLTHEGRATLAVLVLMAGWWLTEAVPLPVTSLLPIVLFPLLGISTVKAAAAPFASDVIFLFMGGLMLGLAMERWGLHRRVAMVTIGMVGTSPAMLVGGTLLATAVLGMWVSNTAAAVMTLPIAVSIVAVVDGAMGTAGTGGRRGPSAFASASVLAVAYGASIGGVGTVIGTPPNAILAAYVKEWGLPEMTFTRWLWVGLPTMLIFLPMTWVVLTRVVFRVPMRPIGAVHERIMEERAGLGQMSRGEWSVLVVFLSAVIAWVLREPAVKWLGLIGTDSAGKKFDGVTDSGIAIAAAIALFLIPVDTKRRVFALDWPTAVRLPWGVLLLFGGGLSLADAMTSTGVDVFIGGLFGHLQSLHPLLIVLIVTACIVALTEVASNTAIATTFLPIMNAAAAPLGVDPHVLLLPTVLAASLAFAMPMGTPPNALVFASGHVTMRQMVRAGLVLDILSVVIITLMIYFLGPWLVGYTRP